MSDLQAQARRIDFQTASKVQCGIALKITASEIEAIRYMRGCGVPDEVIARVLSDSGRRRHRCTIDVPDNRRAQIDRRSFAMTFGGAYD